MMKINSIKMSLDIPKPSKPSYFDIHSLGKDTQQRVMDLLWKDIIQSAKVVIHYRKGEPSPYRMDLSLDIICDDINNEKVIVHDK